MSENAFAILWRRPWLSRMAETRRARAQGRQAKTMAEAKKPENDVKSVDQILITRAILEEVKENIHGGRFLTDEQLLTWMQRMTGRPVKLVETLPDDEEIVVICSLVPVVPGSLVAQCSDCGATVYHSRNAPPNSRKICTRCGPRLGH